MAEKNNIIDALCSIFERNKALKHIDALALKKLYADRADITFEDFLLEEGIVAKEDLLKALGEYYNRPTVDIMGDLLQHHLVHMFPKDLMLRNFFVPYDRDGDVLIVVAAHPEDPYLPELIGKFVSYDVTFIVGLARGISDAVKEFYDKSIMERALDKTPVDEERERQQAEKDINEYE